MDWRELFDVQHSHVNSAQLGPVPLSYQDLVLDGLEPDEVRRRPGTDLNSIAWLLWHMARCEDAAVNAVICEADQVLDALDNARLSAPAMASAQVQHLVDLGLFGPNAAQIPPFWASRPLKWFLWLAVEKT